MDETRVDRYKEYRNSFIKEGAVAPNSLDAQQDTIDVHATTSTLPIDEVMNVVHEENEKDVLYKQIKRKNLIKLLIKIAISIILIGGLVVLGIFAWR